MSNAGSAKNYELPAEGAFPATRRDWLVTQVAAGDEGRLQANAFVMEIYAPALEAYVRGSSFRSLGEARDLVNGFFASRLGRSDFFDRWLASELPLRRWLSNGFLFFLHEESRSKRRHAGLVLDDENETPTPEPGAVESFESSWAREVVRRACGRAGEICDACGWHTHWELFLRHHGAGVAYATIAEELGIDPKRAAGLARTAGGVLRRAILEILVRDGVAENDLEREAERLVLALRSR